MIILCNNVSDNTIYLMSNQRIVCTMNFRGMKFNPGHYPEHPGPKPIYIFISQFGPTENRTRDLLIEHPQCQLLDHCDRQIKPRRFLKYNLIMFFISQFCMLIILSKTLFVAGVAALFFLNGGYFFIHMTLPPPVQPAMWDRLHSP